MLAPARFTAMTDALKIAIIQRFLPGRSHGGVGHFTHGLGNALVQRGHSITVFSQHPAPEGALYKVTQLALPRRVSDYQPAQALCFPWQVARQDYSAFDIIHAQGDDHLISRRNAPPVVRTFHASSLSLAFHNGMSGRSLRRVFMFLYFYLLDLISAVRADASVAVSRDILRHYPRVRQVIPNGIDLKHFQCEHEKAPHPVILFVGDMNSQKRGRFLLRVFQQEVRPSIPESELWLVYRDDYEDKRQGVGIRWIGVVDADQLPSLYCQAWVFCLPSTYEGFGRPYVEAMAAGIPVVATPNPGAREVLDDGRCGLVVSDENLGETLTLLLARPDMRQRYGELGSTRARVYAWEKVAQQYEDVYRTVLRKCTQ
jgi:phosphatidyl-myo-inositol alpha-mannosyltransferase